MKSLLPRTVTDPLLPSGMVGNDRLGISDLDADHCGSRRRHTIARQDQTLHSAQALALPWLHLLQDVSVRRLSPNSCRPTSIVPRPDLQTGGAPTFNTLPLACPLMSVEARTCEFSHFLSDQ